MVTEQRDLALGVENSPGEITQAWISGALNRLLSCGLPLLTFLYVGRRKSANFYWQSAD
jgi:hypothetical protein